MVVSTSTQTVPILTFDAESQSYNLPNQSFENIEWKRLHRRKHHKDRVQIRIEPEDLEETRDRMEVRDRMEAREREEVRDRGDVRDRGVARENSELGHDKNGSGRDKWKFDRREFYHFLKYFQ